MKIFTGQKNSDYSDWPSSTGPVSLALGKLPVTNFGHAKILTKIGHEIAILTNKK